MAAFPPPHKRGEICLLKQLQTSRSQPLTVLPSWLCDLRRCLNTSKVVDCMYSGRPHNQQTLQMSLYYMWTGSFIKKQHEGKKKRESLTIELSDPRGPETEFPRLGLPVFWDRQHLLPESESLSATMDLYTSNQQQHGYKKYFLWLLLRDLSM